MKAKILILLLSVTVTVNAQSIKINGKSLFDYIANTAVFAENQVPPHTPIAPFNNRDAAIAGDWTGSPWVLSLNGTWKFQWHEVPERASWDFYRPGYDASDWDEIAVPSCWQMQGFGDPKFRNVQQPFPANPPYPPADYNPVGSYLRTFTVPGSWDGRRILLYFEGVKSAAFVWINGQYVGYNEGGMEPAEFDVTGMIRIGDNQIAVQVLRFADATYLECQDMWRLSGIFRPVYVLAMPPVHIRDYFVTTTLDQTYRDADLSVTVEVVNSTRQMQSGYSVHGVLLDRDGNTVTTMTGKLGRMPARNNTTVKLTKKINNPQKWSAEKPNLYPLVLELADAKGQVLHLYSQPVGFRQVEVRQQALWLNGVPVKLNGVCSHVHHPETGRTMDLATMRTDLTLMQQFNINCVRTSHYPQNREYYDLADRLGIYVIDETNDEAHATEWLSDRPEWRDMYLDRARNMVYRDRNHPSVIIWSAGNESGSGANICALIAEGKRIDPSRPAWLYGGNNDYYPGPGPMPCEDIVGPRYPTPYELKVDIAQSDDPRPSFMDEYVAVTGNGGGMLDEFWEVIRAYPRTIGGAVWDWVSPTINMPWIETPDESPFGNNGAIMGRHQLVAGRFGRALALSGQDAWVEIYRAPELDLDGEALTMSLWVKPKAWNGLESYLTKGDWQFGLRQPDPDSLEFYLTCQERVSLKVPVPASWQDQWHHLAAVYDGELMQLWIDTIQLGSIKQSGTIINAPFPINLGRNWETDDQDFTGNMCDALLDRVAIFDRALTPTAIADAGPGAARLWLDFESTQTTNTFYSYGIGGRTYGLIWADRRPQPELFQLKKSGQPVTAEPVDLDKGTIRITNWHQFTNLKERVTAWEVTADGQVIQNGNLALDLEPLQSTMIQVPFAAIQPEPGVRYHLALSWTLPAATAWANAGHEIAFVQFELPVQAAPAAITMDSSARLQLVESDSAVTIAGENFSYGFCKKSGVLTSIMFQGQELLKQGPRMNVWRAPLANDLDRWTWGRGRVTNAQPALSGFVANGFWAAGLDRLEHQVDDFQVRKNADRICLMIRTHAAAPGTAAAFDNRYDYTVLATGDILLRHTITPEGIMPQYLPKAGLQLVLKPEFQHWTWLGRGPFETYPDRKTGARIGLWQTTVAEAYVPYLIPQDHGNRTDVQWTVLSNGRIGLFIQAAEPVNVSARQWDTDNLSRALVIPQLKPFDGVTLNIDARVSGVGCTAVSILNKYKVFPGEVQYAIRLRPVEMDKTKLSELGREVDFRF